MGARSSCALGPDDEPPTDDSAALAAAKLFGGTHARTRAVAAASSMQTAGPVVPSPATHDWENRRFTWTDVQLNGSGNSIVVDQGESIHIELRFSTSYSGGGYCPGCVVQLYYGLPSPRHTHTHTRAHTSTRSLSHTCAHAQTHTTTVTTTSTHHTRRRVPRPRHHPAHSHHHPAPLLR